MAADTSTTDALLRQLITQQGQIVEQFAAFARVMMAGKEPDDPPTKPVDLPVITAPLVRPATDPLAPPNFGTLIASIAAMIALPANNVIGTVDQGTLGSLLPLAGAVASAFGVPGWILPVVGKFFSGISGASK